MSEAKRPYESPRFSKGRVDRAGERIGTPNEEPKDLEVLENWRAAHANILNTFKTILYKRAKNFDLQIAQRLKRRPTIIDKLTREPGMRLSRMHDIAGCRVIFQDFDQLYEFRDLVLNGSFEHKRRASEDDRWNYIENPKSSGYRGIHDVYIRGAATACPCAAKRCMRSVAQVIRSSRNLSRRRVHRLPFATRCLAEHAA